MPWTLGDAVDQIITVPMRVGREAVSIERHRHIYEEARARQGGKALAMQAAQQITDNVRAFDRVILLTGLGETPWWPAGEMDGPPGVASIARALAYGIEAQPIYMAEPGMVGPIKASSQAIGAPVYDEDVVRKFRIWRSSSLVSVPVGPEGARDRAITLLERIQPAAVIACEKLGPNAQNEYGAVDGQIPLELIDSTSTHLFEEAQKRGVLTIGIGDVGNELGLGIIEDIVNGYRGPNPPYRTGGAGTRVKADVAITATVSNWGAYGLAACMAFLTETLDCLHDESTESRVLAACAAAGAVDFHAGVPIDHVDGKELIVHQAVVTLLRTVVKNRLRELQAGSSTDGSKHRFVPEKFTEAAYQWAEWRSNRNDDLDPDESSLSSDG